jgi:trehalose-6-phosphatase
MHVTQAHFPGNQLARLNAFVATVLPTMLRGNAFTDETKFELLHHLGKMEVAIESFQRTASKADATAIRQSWQALSALLAHGIPCLSSAAQLDYRNLLCGFAEL